MEKPYLIPMTMKSVCETETIIGRAARETTLAELLSEYSRVNVNETRKLFRDRTYELPLEYTYTHKFDYVSLVAG